MQLRVNEPADHLDIAAAFASNLALAFVAKKLMSRARGKSDQRVIIISVTQAGRKLLQAIDAAVKIHVEHLPEP
ncbi:MAG TPA: hypothetical protein VH684_00095 [Xanthobacteraceae bacterium]